MKKPELEKIYSLFVSCPQYVEDLLEEEIMNLGAQNLKKTVAGVYFQSNLTAAYRICYHSRIASRLMLVLAEFEAGNKQELYDYAHSVPWIEHFSPTQTFAVDCTLRQGFINNRNYGALLVKDAVADYFRNLTGRRPSVDNVSPEIRIHLHINKSRISIALDLSGESLHKRGYRISGSEASLKENVAAAMLLRAGWPELAAGGAGFADPMCGSGTLLIEAAMIAGNIPAGRFRKRFGFLQWKQHQSEMWEMVICDAEKQCRMGRIGPLIGYDKAESAIRAARANIKQAGLKDYISIEKCDISQADHPASPEFENGLIAVNPPYGVRLGNKSELVRLYQKLGEIMVKNFYSWRAVILTSDKDLSHATGLRAVKTNFLYNGPIKCLLACFELTEEWAYRKYAETPGGIKPDEALVNRLKKNLKRLGRWARRHGVSCYRLYDADLPEYAVAIDYYDGKYLHIQEYVPPATIDKRKARKRLEYVRNAVRELLKVDEKYIFLKQRLRQRGNSQYMRHDFRNTFYIINENDLRFKVNFTDYLDPGIFLLTRNLRMMIRELCPGRRFLNLFAYTGTATVYAAAGTALSTVSVDTNQNYLDWAKENMKLNGLYDKKQQFVRQDCMEWLQKNQAVFDIILLDPPTFSNAKKKTRIFELQREHVTLIRLCMQHLSKNGVLVFSNNYKRFKLNMPALSDYQITDLCESTLPEDFKRKSSMYKCWHIMHC